MKGKLKSYHTENDWKQNANLAWNTCMSKPDLGKLFVPVPNLSLTDWLSCAAFWPVSE